MSKKFDYAALDEYQRREMGKANVRVFDINKEPLADRKEAAKEFGEALRDPSLIAERIGWLLDGSYGQGEMLVAKRSLASPRSNKAANMTHLIGVYEWQCPVAMGIAQWKKLTPAQKKALDVAVLRAIKRASEE